MERRGARTALFQFFSLFPFIPQFRLFFLLRKTNFPAKGKKGKKDKKETKMGIFLCFSTLSLFLAFCEGFNLERNLAQG